MYKCFLFVIAAVFATGCTSLKGYDTSVPIKDINGDVIAVSHFVSEDRTPFFGITTRLTDRYIEHDGVLEYVGQSNFATEAYGNGLSISALNGASSIITADHLPSDSYNSTIIQSGASNARSNSDAKTRSNADSTSDSVSNSDAKSDSRSDSNANSNSDSRSDANSNSNSAAAAKTNQSQRQGQTTENNLKQENTQKQENSGQGGGKPHR